MEAELRWLGKDESCELCVEAALKRLNCRGWTNCSCRWLPSCGSSSMGKVGVRIMTVGERAMQPEM